jgi:hypothetical protein
MLLLCDFYIINKMNTIELPYVKITYKEPIVYFRYEKEIELGFPEIRELIACAEKLSGKRPYVTLSDVQTSIGITNEGKRVLSDPKNLPYFRGTAALVKNNLYKFAIDFMNTFNRPKYPYKAFVNEEEAVAWLLTLPLDDRISE